MRCGARKLTDGGRCRNTRPCRWHASSTAARERDVPRGMAPQRLPLNERPPDPPEPARAGYAKMGPGEVRTATGASRCLQRRRRTVAMTDPYMHQHQYDAGWPPCPSMRVVTKERALGVWAVLHAIWTILDRGRKA